MSSQSISPAAVGPVELIADYACEIGENPLWHSIERRLYWCDIPRGRLFRFDPESGVHEQCYQGRIVGGFTFQSDGALLLFMDRGTIAVWREGTLTEIVKEIPGELDSRFNDVIADPHGRVFCGTMSTDKRTGRLYRLDLDGSLEVMLEGIRCSNGLAFTRDLKSLYYTDSFAQEIYLFDYSIEDGTLSNRRVYAKFEDEDGLPDGATIDSAGRLWSALWDGGAVARIGPDGKIETKIEFPARKVSSITFGGADYTDMYVTTAGGNIRETDGELAGSLFRCKSKVPGVPEFYSHIGLA
jgi:sugar lactone lactonase YvrE